MAIVKLNVALEIFDGTHNKFIYCPTTHQKYFIEKKKTKTKFICALL